ncbi:MAG: hypothetical protein IAE77_27325 [Prosthecobacter sp.]|jgi:hypothetical protein|uniref:hypothetical protein n=1 Tax=Prosthecobacter sp. TaxID=1965333 RepID=UPI001A0FDA2C|nr:hypothetical protein [Prosthecobacter sp.]MBE2287197.1 hypothetical protein [Prosthecobacter sp.]
MDAALSPDEPDFASAAQKVRRWVVLRRWLDLLRMTWIPAALVIALILLAALRGGGLFSAWAGLIGWMVGSLAYAWWQRPSEFSALALWDQAAGRREAFASAWWFENRGEGGEAARAHIAAQRVVLPQALPALTKDLPLRPDRWLSVPLLLALLGSFLSVITAPPSNAVPMDETMVAKAADEAKKLAQTDWEKKKLAGLTEDEHQQIENLKQKLDQTATELANSAGKDARDVLAELERRARDAEKLADDLDKAKQAWASDKLIDELRKHADTADLGDSVAAKNAQSAAKAAESLASQLQSPQLTAEAKERMNDTLKDIQKQADAEDRQRTVGQNVLAAGDQMQKGDAKGAGEEFQKLADKMRDAAMREQARDELQQLAQQLRNSGSNIAGQNDSRDGAMQPMSQAGQSGQPAGQQGEAPQVGQAQGAQQSLAPPGMGQPQPDQMQQQPSQGNGQGQQQQPQMMTMGQGQQGQPGQQGQSNNNQPMLMAPVPGKANADSKGPVMLLPGEAETPPGGPVVVIPGSGLPPGAGKAELNNSPTQKIETGNQSLVQAQQNSEGQSTVRSVEGGARTEQATRSATQTALDAIQAEEAALDEAALPPARREQVRRYFNELRKRFEKK